MPARNVFLTDHFDSFINDGIEAGRYKNASEVVREGLRLLEQREREYQAKVDWLRGAVQVGIDELNRGDGIVFETLDELDAHLKALHREVVDEMKRSA